MRFYLAALFVFSVFITACAPVATTSEAGLRVITEAYPPYNFVDKNGNVTGQSVEIVRAMLQKLNITASIEVMPLSDGLNLAQKGPSTTVFSINRTPQREALFKWVGPIGDYKQVFYARKISSLYVKTLDDARAAGKIGVYKGDAGNQFLVSQGFANLDESPTDVEALKKLMDNRVQLWLGNKGGLAVTAKEAGISTDELVEFPVVVIQADMYIALSRDIPDGTVTTWQKTLDALKQEKDADGRTAYDKILAKYSDINYVQGLLK
ncbi:MAG: transporter substrate-binding domain-containing protein [Dehalococcoidia bacterium]|nr:transporter substrate-binding domain-containing protein [Dehalococcoidia bacterium]